MQSPPKPSEEVSIADDPFWQCFELATLLSGSRKDSEATLAGLESEIREAATTKRIEKLIGRIRPTVGQSTHSTVAGEKVAES
jgi:hypothetical protein